MKKILYLWLILGSQTLASCSEKEMDELSAWVAGLRDAEGNPIGREIPLHSSRFFPRFHMTDRKATDVRHVYRLAEVAGEKLRYVYTGNC